MKEILNFFKKWILILCSFAILINISACFQDSDILSCNSNEQNDDRISKENKVLIGSCVVTYLEDIDSYSAAAINIPNGSFIRIPAKSLVPPAELAGTDVEIIMAARVDLTNNEIIFTFEPHGCEFSTPAELCLSWKDLGIQNVTLFYLDEENNREEHLPDQVDDSKKRMILLINHFSRYAVAYSN
jgi:hypothetical protein